ncbi:MAG: hypothetical protein ACRDV2_09405 [Actinomycetes bacterium]
MHTAARLDRVAVAGPQGVDGGVVPAPIAALVPPRGGTMPQSMSGAERGALAMFGTLTGIATLSAVLVVGGALLGYVVDGMTGSPHVFVFVGMVAGVALAVLTTRSIVRRFFR